MDLSPGIAISVSARPIVCRYFFSLFFVDIAVFVEWLRLRALLMSTDPTRVHELTLVFSSIADVTFIGIGFESSFIDDGHGGASRIIFFLLFPRARARVCVRVSCCCCCGQPLWFASSNQEHFFS